MTVRPHRTSDPHTHCRTVTEVTTRETVYRLTSLYPEAAGPAELLALVRHHGSVEAMHHIEDGSYNADGSTRRTGHGPANITTLTRLAIALLRHRGFATVPDGQRYWSTPRRALLALAG